MDSTKHPTNSANVVGTNEVRHRHISTNGSIIRIIVAVLVMLFVYIILSIYFINGHIQNMYAFRVDETASRAQNGVNILGPIRDDVVEGRTDITADVLELAPSQIQRWNESTEDALSDIFLMMDDGYLLTYPFDPSLEERNSTEIVDSEGRHIFQELLQVTANSTHKGYVYHMAARPGSTTPEPVLTYVVAIPELNVVVGARSYLGEIAAESYRYAWRSIGLSFALVVFMFIIIIAVTRPILRGYRVLLSLFDQVTQQPDLMPEVPTHNFRIGTEGWRMLDGFQMMMQRMQSATRLLRQSQRLLEERVDERTRELQVRYQESERRREVAEGLRDVLDTLNSESSLEDTLDYILQQCIKLLTPTAAAVFELTPNGQEMRLRASSGLPSQIVKSMRGILLDKSPFEMAVAQREAMVLPVNGHLPNSADANIHPHYASALVVPVQVREMPHGVLVLYYQDEHQHSEEDLALALALADQAALAIENGSMRARERQVAAAAERSRLARELHDSVSQALFGIALGARTIHSLLPTATNTQSLVEPLDYILQLAQGGIAEMRSLIFELRPESLESEGIVAGFRKHAAALQSRYNIKVETVLDEEPKLPIDIKEALYRVGVEAMHNTVKHARATQIDLSLRVENNQAILQIHDNGIGFDPQQLFPGHLGLQSMRERVQQLQGDLTITSAPNAGTTIRVNVPVPNLSTRPEGGTKLRP